MTLHYGFTDELKKLRAEIEILKGKKIFQYTLNYPKTSLNTAVYPERFGSAGYKYITTTGLTSESTITLLTHSFSTATGKIIDNGVFSYSFEFLDKNGNFSYFNIKEIDIAPLKVPKSGSKYNMFILNKTFVFSNIIKHNLKNFIVFSVYITQKSGTLSDDTSDLELYITL